MGAREAHSSRSIPVHQQVVMSEVFRVHRCLQIYRAPYASVHFASQPLLHAEGEIASLAGG